MNITELDFTDGREYSIKGSDIVYTVHDGELMYGHKNNGYLLDDVSAKELASLDFTEVTDWRKVTVDTPILVGSSLDIKRHFAKYEDGKVFAYASGTTSFSGRKADAWSNAILSNVEAE